MSTYAKPRQPVNQFIMASNYGNFTIKEGTKEIATHISEHCDHYVAYLVGGDQGWRVKE